MKSLSQSEYGELRSLYQQVYAPKFETILDEMTDQEVNELTEEIIEETVEEFFLECLEEGLDIGSVEETLCESLETSLMMLNEVSDSYYADAVKSGKAKAAKAKRAEIIGKVKGAVKKVGSALKAGAGKAAGAAKAGAKAAGKVAVRGAGYAAGAAGRAASTAKSEFKKGYERGSKGSSSSSSDSGSSYSGSSSPSSSSSSSGSSSSGSTRRAVGGAVRKVGSLLKKGLKKAVGGAARAVSKGADKVATRLGEEAVGEGIDFKGAAREQARRDAIQAEKDKKSPSSKQRRLALGKFRPGASAEERAEGGRDAMREKGTSPIKNGKKMFEELQATGLFTEKEIDAILEASENIDEAITSEKGKAKMKAMLDARTTASGRAKAGKGENVAQIKHIGRANVDNLGGTPPNPKIAKNPVKSRSYGGTGNKAARRAGTYKD